jgi:2,4-dienoyl-CoA reductase-like NADH-dependent reductase (Old Yellow Enzyme family)
MSLLFESTRINGMTLSNRFVRSATWEGMASEEGAVTSKLIDLMTALAKGDVGLIISSHAYVRRDGQAGPWQLGIYDDGLIEGLKKMTAAVHEQNGRIIAQLAHAGFYANPKLTQKQGLAPSNVEGLAKSPRQEMTVDDIHELAAAFSQAAERARSAGFDGVQIHAAHGYLLSQFLSPLYNHRTDDFGGDIENRARFLMEVLKGIRQRVGPDYPVLVKLNSQDFFDNGLNLEDALRVGQMLTAEGIDAIELSGGLLIGGKMSPSRMGIKIEEKEAYFQKEARAFKSKINVPLILVGGNRSFNVCEDIVNQGVADYISMSRPFIREPDLVERWKSGDRSKSRCLSDNQCFGPAMAGEGIYCVTEKKGR